MRVYIDADLSDRSFMPLIHFYDLLLLIRADVLLFQQHLLELDGCNRACFGANIEAVRIPLLELHGGNIHLNLCVGRIRS